MLLLYVALDLANPLFPALSDSPGERAGVGRGDVPRPSQAQHRQVRGDHPGTHSKRRGDRGRLHAVARARRAPDVTASLAGIRTAIPPLATCRRPIPTTTSFPPVDRARSPRRAQVASGWPRPVDPWLARWRASMADLTERQKQEYWRYNVRLTTILLVIWFVVTYSSRASWPGWLNQYTILGFPLGYYMAAQGSLAIFVVEIAVYAHLMNTKDRRVRHPRGGLADHEPGQDLRPLHGRLSRRHHPHRHRRARSGCSATR